MSARVARFTRRFLLLVLAAGTTAALAAPARGAGTGEVVVLHLTGVVDPFEADYLDGGIEAANQEGATAIVITIDTPGGLDSSMRKITEAILNSGVPVITYVSPSGARAASAGTFILLSGSVAAMAPGTNVGAAHPVGVSGAIEQDKVTNDAVAYIRSIAEQRGKNPDWAEDAVRNSVSITAEDALALEPPVIDLIAPSLSSLLQQLNGRTVAVGGGGTVTLDTTDVSLDSRDMGLGARLLHGLLSPDLAFLLFYVGLGLIVLEFLHPGIGVAGILGLLSVVGSFVSFGMLPFRIVGIVLLIASAVFFLLELKAPGIGFATLGGVVCLVLGGLFLFDPSVPNAQVSPWVIIPVALMTAGFFGFVVKIAVRLRHRPAKMQIDNLIGTVGVVTTPLTPRGVVHVASEHWTADSLSGTIPAGNRVRIVGADGLRLRVEPVEDEEPWESSPVPGREEGKVR